MALILAGTGTRFLISDNYRKKKYLKKYNNKKLWTKRSRERHEKTDIYRMQQRKSNTEFAEETNLRKKEKENLKWVPEWVSERRREWLRKQTMEQVRDNERKKRWNNSV